MIVITISSSKGATVARPIEKQYPPPLQHVYEGLAASISPDGNLLGFVAFATGASNLVSDDRNGVSDAFVYDRETSRIERISTGPNGEEADGATFPPRISADGRFVAFTSKAKNLVTDDVDRMSQENVFVYDRVSRRTQRVSMNGDRDSDSDSRGPAISADGRFVSFVTSASLWGSWGINGGVMLAELSWPK